MGTSEHRSSDPDTIEEQSARSMRGNERRVQALGPHMSGRWLVITHGTTHVWDLDAMTYERRPGPASRAGDFPYDREPLDIARVTWWPVVGKRSFVWFDDPDQPTILEHYRISSTIAEIRRLRHETRPPAREHTRGGHD